MDLSTSILNTFRRRNPDIPIANVLLMLHGEMLTHLPGYYINNNKINNSNDDITGHRHIIGNVCVFNVVGNKSE